jgi:CRISPR/Cas system CSM-associated protein Csm2 small subunit
MVTQNKLQKELDESITKAGEFDAAMAKTSFTSDLNRGALAKLTNEQIRENKARLASKDALEEWNKQATASYEATQKAGAETEKFSEKLKKALGEALDKAKTNLQDAKEAFDNFAVSVSTSVKAGLSFAAAYQSMQAATQNAGKASEALKDAQADLAKAISKGDIDDIAEAQKRLTEAQKADAIAAEENKQTFLGRIAAQVQGVKEYAANLQTLLQRGLSQDALKYVLEAGAEAGSAIARELVAGNVEAITGPDGINAMVAAAQEAADAVGLNAASRWYQAGIDQATQIVEGLDATLKALTPKLMARMDRIAASLARTVDVTVRITETVTRIVSEIGQGKIPKLAEGGIVTKPTLALIGEAGPEAVVPLSRMATGGGVTVNVNGGLATSAEIGQAVVNAIRAYNRSAGPANIAVA